MGPCRMRPTLQKVPQNLANPCKCHGLFFERKFRVYCLGAYQMFGSENESTGQSQVLVSQGQFQVGRY